MKYVYVYYQHDLEYLDVYIRGVYFKKEDAIKQMNRDIKSWSRLHNYNYEMDKDSNGTLFTQAAYSCNFYMSSQCEWKISIVALDYLEE